MDDDPGGHVPAIRRAWLESTCSLHDLRRTPSASSSSRRSSTHMRRRNAELDVKARLAHDIAEERLGWRPRFVGSSRPWTTRPRIRRWLRSIWSLVRAGLPATSREVRLWLQTPAHSMRGLWFVRLPGAAVTPRPVPARCRAHRWTWIDQGVMTALRRREVWRRVVGCAVHPWRGYEDRPAGHERPIEVGSPLWDRPVDAQVHPIYHLRVRCSGRRSAATVTLGRRRRPGGADLAFSRSCARLPAASRRALPGSANPLPLDARSALRPSDGHPVASDAEAEDVKAADDVVGFASFGSNVVRTASTCAAARAAVMPVGASSMTRQRAASQPSSSAPSR